MGCSVPIAMLGIFLSVILVRTVRFVPKPPEPVAQEPVFVDEEKIVADLCAMIRCKTVSNIDENLVDRKEFEKFEALLCERFPAVHAACSFQKIGKTGLLYKLAGASSGNPSVCMAHYDVVPIREEKWTKPAFDGLVEDGCIWGRGTLDTKGTLCAIMEALEQLLKEGYVPKHDLYLSFSGEEEIDGSSCSEIVSWFEEKGIKPMFVLDEGGAVVDHAFPGVDGECALIGIGEKGSVNMDFWIESAGGHASTPPVHMILAELSRAVVNITRHPFPCRWTPPVLEMLDVLGRHSSFGYRMIFANLWLFAPILDLYCKKSGGELNALMRTTVAVTRMEGSKAYNVLPSKARFGINMRLIGTDTVESATKYLQHVIGNKKIKPVFISGMNPSPYSNVSCEEWEKLKTVVRKTWPDAVVSPYLMMACSDAKHYCRITDRVYRFSAMRLSKEERAMIHGNDERVPIETMIKTVQFYVRLMKVL